MSETPERDPETRAETDRETRGEYDTSGIKLLSGFVSLVGLWIAASPFLYDTTEMALWNNVIVGLAVFLVAGFSYYRLAKRLGPSTGSASLVALLGLWALIAPFAMAFDNEALLWSNVVAGAIIALIAGYNAYASRRARTAPAGARA